MNKALMMRFLKKEIKLREVRTAAERFLIAWASFELLLGRAKANHISLLYLQIVRANLRKSFQKLSEQLFKLNIVLYIAKSCLEFFICQKFVQNKA